MVLYVMYPHILVTGRKSNNQNVGCARERGRNQKGEGRDDEVRRRG